jgi:catechol 2,3-dioxygenase-like lactoylglutathione lyase family enzyme
MTYPYQSYVEHVAIRVKDINWHIRFFRDALGMTVRASEGPAENPVQIWTVGGVQLVANPAFEGSEGRLAHLGIFTEDVEAAIAASKAAGAVEAPQGPHWLLLRDGLLLELMQATPGAVAAALAVDPRASAS